MIWVMKLCMVTPVFNVRGDAVGRKPWLVKPVCDLGDEAADDDPCV